MPDFLYQSQRGTLKQRIIRFLAGIWPRIYNLINELFFGTIRFFKFLIGGFRQ